MSDKLISVDFNAQFGFLKKPDINDGIYLTYNCLHKPALLGILGAIIGLGGYTQAYSKNKKILPEYYYEFNKLKIGIQPLNSSKGNYQKTVIRYNNSVGYANDQGGTLIIDEQTLIKPSYKIFLLLNIENKTESQLYNNLKTNESVYIPYLGKNDFQLWWDHFTEYDYEDNFNPKTDYEVETIFIKKEGTTIKDSKASISFDILDNNSNFNELKDNFIYFERLPIGFNEEIKHYKKEKFVFSNWKLKREYLLENLYFLKQNKKIIQLF